MTPPGDSVRVTNVRVSNFRSLQNVDVSLEDLTVLIGANNTGKSTFLDALYLAIGASRKVLGQEDIYIKIDEALPPKDRVATIDVMIRPTTADGTIANTFPAGSYWTSLWGTGISQDDQARDFVGVRSKLAWDLGKGEYALSKRFLKEWLAFTKWLGAEEKDEWVTVTHIEPVALHYIDAKRDLDDDLRRPGSFWRRLTDDLGLEETDIAGFEEGLSKLNHAIIVPLHVKLENLVASRRETFTAQAA